LLRADPPFGLLQQGQALPNNNGGPNFGAAVCDDTMF
jgi:hypothetical protein